LRKSSLTGSRRIVDTLANRLGMWPRWLAGAAVVFLMFMTSLDVIMRYFFHRPMFGVYELTEYFMVIMVFFSITYAAVQKSHVEIEMVTDLMPKKAQAILAIITNILGLILWVLICWQNIDNAFYLMRAGQMSVALGIPAWPFYILAGIGSLFLCPWFVSNILNRLSEVLPE
jgi:TRAP-type transport system small permease protein